MTRTKIASWPGAMVVVAGIALALGATFAAACGGDDSDEEQAHDEQAHMDDNAEGATEITVAASDLLKFEPSEITVKAGQRVRLMLDNSEGTADHDFTIDEIPVHDVMAMGGSDAHSGAHGDAAHFAMHVAADPGHMSTLEFTATEPGEYEFYCTVPGHADAGMRGRLIVQ